MNIGFGGKLSGGKTITSIMYAYDLAKKGKKVISNIELRFPSDIETVFLSNSQFVDYLKANYNNQEKLQEMFFNSVLILDEVGNLISARKSSSALNELITGFMMMVGKLDCDVIYTFQVKESQVDKVLREVSNVYGNCYRVSAKGVPLINKPRIITEKVLITVIFEFDFDILGVKIGSLTFDPEPYYSFYNTREVTLLDRTKYLRGGSKDLRVG